MSLSIQRSVIEQFNFNGKTVRSVYIRQTGECLIVASDVYRAMNYSRKAGVQAIQRLVPEEYKMRVKDVSNDLQGVLKFEYPVPDAVLLKEPGLYCFLLRCGKEQADSLLKWAVEEVLPREVRKLAKTVEEKDSQLALLNDDLVEAKEHARQLEFNNVGLQGEIRAMDQELHRKMKEVQDLIQNRYVPRKYPIDNVLCFVNKNSDERHQFYVIRCQRKSLETHKRCLRNRYPNMVVLGECEDANAVHRWCRFKKNVIDDFHRNHFNLNEEARELMETAFDIEV